MQGCILESTLSEKHVLAIEMYLKVSVDISNGFVVGHAW